jgi:acyl carrier protein
MSVHQLRDGVADRLAEIWRTALDAPDIPEDGDFFELGGTSLLAIRISAAVAAAFAVHTPPSDLIADSSFPAMAARIREALAVATPEAAR